MGLIGSFERTAGLAVGSLAVTAFFSVESEELTVDFLSAEDAVITLVCG